VKKSVQFLRRQQTLEVPAAGPAHSRVRHASKGRLPLPPKFVKALLKAKCASFARPGEMQRKDSVGGDLVYILWRRNAKKRIPGKGSPLS
jgi:hypothetical protein